jgi:hypothetical protein
MRKGIILLVAAVACAKTETPAADTAAPAAAPVPAPPAPLTAADVAGTWTGTSMAEGSDSVTSRWTVVRVTDSTSKFIAQGSKDSVDVVLRYDADSMIATSAPYTDPAAPKGTPKVTFRSVGRLKDGKLVGNATVMLASKPDSVVARSRWEATKAP